jgi:DNA modification methylase
MVAFGVSPPVTLFWRAYGLELDPAYIDVAIRRYETYTGKAATLAERREEQSGQK